jgi:hypothetical protein
MHFSLPSHFRKPRPAKVKAEAVPVEVAAEEPTETAARKAPRKRVKKA